MALLSGAESSLVGLNENMRYFSFCMGVWDRMLSTKEFFPGRGKRLAARIWDFKGHEIWGGVVIVGKMTHVFGLVSAFKMGTCRCSEPLAQGTGVWDHDQCSAMPDVGIQTLSLVDISSTYSAVGSVSRSKWDDLEPCRMVWPLRPTASVCTKPVCWLLHFRQREDILVVHPACRNLLLYQLLFQISFILLLSCSLFLLSSIIYLLSTCLLQCHFSLLSQPLLLKSL